MNKKNSNKEKEKANNKQGYINGPIKPKMGAD